MSARHASLSLKHLEAAVAASGPGNAHPGYGVTSLHFISDTACDFHETVPWPLKYVWQVYLAGSVEEDGGDRRGVCPCISDWQAFVYVRRS